VTVQVPSHAAARPPAGPGRCGGGRAAELLRLPSQWTQIRTRPVPACPAVKLPSEAPAEASGPSGGRHGGSDPAGRLGVSGWPINLNLKASGLGPDFQFLDYSELGVPRRSRCPADHNAIAAPAAAAAAAESLAGVTVAQSESRARCRCHGQSNLQSCTRV
jgi:hypothetical protein